MRHDATRHGRATSSFLRSWYRLTQRLLEVDYVAQPGRESLNRLLSSSTASSNVRTSHEPSLAPRTPPETSPLFRLNIPRAAPTAAL
eukprot:CAMPEP_0185834654 /NCGR_PEP_ID=MMETSP1353-20130828/5871_1 /TAXON_ID=1077150 /ORGANISM="Erythrolobus australicus, Strain CCMP3124" /LENGTH=86 /DNA_ID=CAMNT_0028533127 /DNA_START=168 /DNA_END=425 /DNA_ORIENTATION=-